MIRYRDNLTAQKLAQFMAEIDALNTAYAAAHDALHTEPMPDEWEDEMDTLRRAALNRDQP